MFRQRMANLARVRVAPYIWRRQDHRASAWGPPQPAVARHGPHHPADAAQQWLGWEMIERGLTIAVMDKLELGAAGLAIISFCAKFVKGMPQPLAWSGIAAGTLALVAATLPTDMRPTNISIVCFIAAALFVGAGIHFWNVAAPPTVPAAGAVDYALRYRWEPLSKDELLTLRSELRTVPKREMTRICCQGSDCRDLADSLIGLFRNLDWPNVEGENSRAVPEFRGIVLQQKDVSDTRIADAIEKATGGRIQVTISQSDLRPTRLVIGPKP